MAILDYGNKVDEFTKRILDQGDALNLDEGNEWAAKLRDKKEAVYQKLHEAYENSAPNNYIKFAPCGHQASLSLGCLCR